MSYYALILAGGGGTRLWPMSRNQTPKQLLPLVNNHSMFATSVERLAPLFTPDHVYVVTGKDYVKALQKDAPQVPKENFIVEPYGRDSAAAAGLAIAVIYKRDPEAIVAILTADHHIGKLETFREVLAAAGDIATQGHIVTLGISPTYPATGFGYIQQGPLLGTTGSFDYYVAERFTEKPELVRATQFLASGRYSWNSGMFIWKAERALQEFERQQPAMHRLLRELQISVDTTTFETTLNALWDEMPRISIDFAIMEGAENMVVIPVDIGWSDVGTWASLFDVLPTDKFGNCGKGDQENNRIILDTRNTLIVNDRLTVTIGVENLVIVQTDDALLICHKDRTQDVKEIVQYLKENGGDRYL